MSKMIIPKNCKECPKSNYGYKYFLCTQTGKDAVFDYIPDWCPLPDLPERLQVQNPELLDAAYEVLGWNKCLDAITGGKV